MNPMLRRCPALLAPVVGAIALLLAAGPASAVLLYSETDSGDLPGDQNEPLLIGTFAPGSNIVTGHDAMGSEVSSQGDTFGLTLLAGQHIDAIRLTLTNNTNTADGFAATIFQSPWLQVSRQFLQPGATGFINFAPFASQPPGQYNFSTQFTTAEQIANGFDWEWAITVSSVPEPAAASLLLIGLGALGIAARRRRRD